MDKITVFMLAAATALTLILALWTHDIAVKNAQRIAALEEIQ